MYSSLLSISPPILPLSLLRFALHHDGSKVIAGLLVVRSMGSIAVRPLNRIEIGLIRWTTRYSVKTHVLRLPATAEGGFLRNILHIYKVNDLSFGSSDQGIASRILRPTIRMKGSVESISNSGCDGRWWDQRQPVLDCKRERATWWERGKWSNSDPRSNRSFQQKSFVTLLLTSQFKPATKWIGNW